MATLLEQGIMAARKGQKSEAKALFKQVLQADNQNDRAWLWLSEVADTVEERIICVERALTLNPNNPPAKLALERLKALAGEHASVALSLVAGPAQTKSPALTKTSPRRPFRLSEQATVVVDGLVIHPNEADNVHNQVTMTMPPAYANNTNGDLSPSKQIATQNTMAFSQPLKASPPRKKKVVQKQVDPDAIPLLPALVFGSLAVTAMGGISMFILLALVS